MPDVDLARDIVTVIVARTDHHQDLARLALMISIAPL
jgi:hypothetical protein